MVYFISYMLLLNMSNRKYPKTWKNPDHSYGCKQAPPTLPSPAKYRVSRIVPALGLEDDK
jgi:hypothetical protein